MASENFITNSFPFYHNYVIVEELWPKQKQVIKIENQYNLFH